jgi:NAD(P)-dependent dehydrogenase (short-subunit alcohol dehydrogenase family)
MANLAQIFDVADKVAVVTGAAGGLGYGIAEALGENGARVVMVDIQGDRLDAAAAALQSKQCRVEPIVLDIGDVTRVRPAIDEVVRRYGRLDVMFANAGVSAGPGFGAPEGRIENVAFDAWERSMRVNLTGTFATVQAAAAHMKPQGQGSIVVTASIAAVKTSPLPAYAYHAAKAAVAHLVRLAALELGPHNVRVNGIAPGPFITNIANGRMHDPEAARKFAATVPLGRLAEVDEIKGLALLLASPASSYMTGAVIPIDGGTAVM